MASSLPHPSEIQAVFFDLDDTLVDARGAWRKAFAATIAELHAAHAELRALGSAEAIYDSHFRRYGEEAHRAAGGGEWQDAFTDGSFERLLAEVLEPDADLARRSRGHLPRLDHEARPAVSRTPARRSRRWARASRSR